MGMHKNSKMVMIMCHMKNSLVNNNSKNKSHIKQYVYGSQRYNKLHAFLLKLEKNRQLSFL